MKRRSLSAIALTAALCFSFAGCAESGSASLDSSADNVIYEDNVLSASKNTSETQKSGETSGTVSENNFSGQEENFVRGGRKGHGTGGGNAQGNIFGKNGGSSAAVSSDTAVTVESGKSALDTSDIFTNRDLEQTADTSSAKTLTAEDNKTLMITEEGVYVIKGSAKNCTITVNADSSAKVQLLLDGVYITNEDFPAIYVISADKCFVTATGSKNTLSVTGEFKSDGDTNTDAVIFSKDDIVLNGTGTLNITSANGNGITGKDDLKITGGTYNITSLEHGIEAKDSISICGGEFAINSKKDAIHCKNKDDGSKGSVYISGGKFDLDASSDGIQATTILQIDGGDLDINSAEGLEATYIQINGGTISIVSSDDGINAARKSTALSPVFEINGGDITIDMGGGDTDAVDSNGDIYVNGGNINITAPTSSFDYDGTGRLSGGTVIVNGKQVSSLPQSMQGGRGGFGGKGNFGGTRA